MLTLVAGLCAGLGACRCADRGKQAPGSAQAQPPGDAAARDAGPAVPPAPRYQPVELPGGSAAALLAEHPERSAAFRRAKAALGQVAEDTRRAGRKPVRVAGSRAWKQLEARTVALMRALARRGDGDPDGAREAGDVMLAAASLLDDPDPFVRGAALRALGLCLGAHGARRLPDYDRFTYALAEAYESRTAPDERLDALLVLGIALPRVPDRVLLPYLIQVAVTAREPAERVAAIRALESCPRRVCRLEGEAVSSWIAAETAPEVKGALFGLAGSVGITELIAWCDGELAGGPFARGCKLGLGRLGTPEAFDALYAHVSARLGGRAADAAGEGGVRANAAEGGDGAGEGGVEVAAAGHGAGEGGVGEVAAAGDGEIRADLVHLAAYAEEPYARERYYALIDRILGQTGRDGHVLAAIARQLGWLRDRARARDIAARQLSAYRTAFPEPPADKAAVIAELERALAHIDAASKPRASNPGGSKSGASAPR